MNHFTAHKACQNDALRQPLHLMLLPCSPLVQGAGEGHQCAPYMLLSRMLSTRPDCNIMHTHINVAGGLIRSHSILKCGYIAVKAEERCCDFLTLFVVSMSAPLSRRSLTTSRSPLLEALLSAFHPVYMSCHVMSCYALV